MRDPRDPLNPTEGGRKKLPLFSSLSSHCPMATFARFPMSSHCEIPSPNAGPAQALAIGASRRMQGKASQDDLSLFLLFCFGVFCLFVLVCVCGFLLLW